MEREHPNSRPAPVSPIDVSLVEHSLSLSYEERIDAHESARSLAEDLKEAGRQFYASQPEVSA